MADDLAAAVRALRSGRLIVYPTDTLLGLGALAKDARAVERLLAAKDRPSGMPISVAVATLEALEPLVELTAPRRAIVRRLLPGPFTLLLPATRDARRSLAPVLLGPDGSLGVRVPDHPMARAIARAAGPITATSANRHGAPASRSIAAARSAFGDRVSVYVRGGPAPSGRPSTLIDLRGETPRAVLRS